MSKTNPGRFFEDYSVGQVIQHAVPRTVSGGERAMYHALPIIICIIKCSNNLES